MGRTETKRTGREWIGLESEAIGRREWGRGRVRCALREGNEMYKPAKERDFGNYRQKTGEIKRKLGNG